MFITLLSRSLMRLLLVPCMLLAGCAYQPVQQPQGQPDAKTQALWDTQQANLAAITDWRIQGKLGVKSPTGNGSGMLHWQQQSSDFELSITGPFGQGSLAIEGSDAWAKITAAGQEPFETSNPEQLLSETYGWPVPINALRYWARGLPAPAPVDSMNLAPEGVLLELQQAGWQLSFDRYKEVQQPNIEVITLPHRVILERQDVRVKLIIKSWAL